MGKKKRKTLIDIDKLAELINKGVSGSVVIGRFSASEDHYREKCREIRIILRDYGLLTCPTIDTCYLTTNNNVLRITVREVGENEYEVYAEIYAKLK